MTLRALGGASISLYLSPNAPDIVTRRPYISSRAQLPVSPQVKPRTTEGGLKRRQSLPPRTANSNKNRHNADSVIPIHPPRRSSSSSFTGVECPCCQRIYSKRSLEFHLKVCSIRRAEEDRRQALMELAIEREKRPPTRLPGQPCYICGRWYTSSSWESHEQKCQEQWNVWNSRLPKELQRRDGPVKPDTTEEAISVVLEQERAAGKTNFTTKDALDKILLEASQINALPV